MDFKNKLNGNQEMTHSQVSWKFVQIELFSGINKKIIRSILIKASVNENENDVTTVQSTDKYDAIEAINKNDNQNDAKV